MNEEKQIELSVEYSESQAVLLESAKLYLIQMDTEYLDKLCTEMYNTATHHDSVAVLNVNYNHSKSQLLRQQAKALCKVKELIESLKECDKMRAKVNTSEQKRALMNNLFGQL